MPRRKTTEEFIQDAKEVHGDKYDYSKVDYKGAHKKVTIICSEHGEFEQRASNHLTGRGCNRCGIERTANKKTLGTNEFINKAKEVHGDKYDYSKTNYTYAKDKITIICSEHGEFEQTANSHLCGKGCGRCGGTKKKTTEEFIEDAKEIHGDKYDYSEINYVGATEKVIIICPKHGKFKQSPSNHLSGYGCGRCGGTKKKTTKEFIQDAKEVHGDKYDYSKVNYKSAKVKVTIICPIHGEFKQLPPSHLKGCGCNANGCAGNIKKSTKEFIKGAKQTHGNKYDYSKVDYNKSSTKVKILCPKHGEFKQLPPNHLKGIGCPDCGIERTANKKTLGTNEFINKAKEVHGDKYNYSKVNYKKAILKVTIICPEHGEFEQTPNNHLSGNGCRNCRTNFNSWNYSMWAKVGKNSNYFDSFKLYIAKIYDKKLEKYFYKIGRTFQTLERRFGGFPYTDYKIVYIKKSENGRKICELERKYKNLCKKYKYIPNKEFGGMYECFTSIDPIVKFLD